jgi:hypothetical protein
MAPNLEFAELRRLHFLDDICTAKAFELVIAVNGPNTKQASFARLPNPR